MPPPPDINTSGSLGLEGSDPVGNLISNLEEGELDPFREGNDCSVSAEWDEALESESELGTEYLRKYSEDLRAIENEEGSRTTPIIATASEPMNLSPIAMT